MRRILFSICCVFAACSVFAQGPKLGIKTGLNISKFALSSNEGTESTGNLTGIHAGLIADFGFSNFSIQPGFFYSMKGSKESASATINGQTYSATSKTRLNYFEVPVNFIYKVPAAAGKLFFGAGPYIAVGLSGKATADESASNTHISADVKFGSGESQVKNPDFGANILAGFELNNGTIIGVNYGLGLSNLSNSSNGSIKNRVFGVSLGYMFR